MMHKIKIFLCNLSKNVAILNKKVYYYRRDNISSATTVFNIQKFINGYSALAKIEENLILKKVIAIFTPHSDND